LQAWTQFYHQKLARLGSKSQRNQQQTGGFQLTKSDQYCISFTGDKSPVKLKRDCNVLGIEGYP
jgi:hypothetical protein